MLLVVSLTLPMFSYALTPPVPCNGALCNPLKVNSLDDFILLIVTGVIHIGYYLVVLALIYSGFKLLEARGSDKKLPEAKANFLYTVIGSAILLGAMLFAEVIGGTVDQLKASSGDDHLLASHLVV